MIADLVCPSKQLVVHCQLIYQKITKGISSARSDDTKSLKSVVVDWITPRDKPLNPPLSRSIKTTRGFHHSTTGALLCPAGLDWNNEELYSPFYVFHLWLTLGRRIRAKLTSGEMAVRGDQWPLLVYASQKFDCEAPWDGLFRSELLVWVRRHLSFFLFPSLIVCRPLSISLLLLAQ